MTFPSKNIAHKNHLDKSRKGGKSGRNRPKFRKGRYCSMECSFFSEGCPYAVLSKTDYDGRCAFVEIEGENTPSIYKFLKGDRLEIISDLLHELMELKKEAKTFEQLLKWFDRKYKLALDILNLPREDRSDTLTPEDIFYRIKENLEYLKAEEEKRCRSDEN